MSVLEQAPETRPELLELFPIKLVGGFIAVDDHVGCRGCAFCLSRRHSLWRDVFAKNWHCDGAFDSPGQAYSLLREMRSFTEAKVPVRFGHNTDSVYQWDFGRALFEMAPAANPFIFMTRFALPAEHADLFDGQPNLLMKMTITPPSRALDIDTDVDAILASVQSVPLNNIYFLIGPIAADNLDGAASVVDRLPKGAWADVKPLTTSGIPGMDAVELPSDEEIDRLREQGASRGLVMTDFFGCVFRRSLRRPFYKQDGCADYIDYACQSCFQRDECQAETNLSAVEAKAREAASRIGLVLGAARHLGPHTSRFECGAPTSRGDETYLSELLNHRILLSSVPEGSEGGSFGGTSREILERWERRGMFPAGEVERLSERIEQSLREG